MKLASAFVVACAIVLANTPTASAQAMEPTKMVAPQDIKWGPGPGTIPPGSQAAVLFGDPSKEGQFALRLRLPKGYRIAAHSHPKPEVVTVISGSLRLGMGDKADESKARALPAGSFVALSPGTRHYVFVDEDTVIQLNSVGPWSLSYVDPKDDPRPKTQ